MSKLAGVIRCTMYIYVITLYTIHSLQICVFAVLLCDLQSGPEKLHSLMHRHFATVCSRIKQYSQKCSENW